MIFDILEEKVRESLLLVPGESLFRAYMPPEVKIAVMIRVPLDGIDVSPYMRNFYHGKMQVITRHTSPIEGDVLANKIGRLLTVESPEFYLASSERGPAQINIFFPQTLPIIFPSLKGNGFEWSQTFDTAFAFEPL